MFNRDIILKNLNAENYYIDKHLNRLENYVEFFGLKKFESG